MVKKYYRCECCGSEFLSGKSESSEHLWGPSEIALAVDKGCLRFMVRPYQK